MWVVKIEVLINSKLTKHEEMDEREIKVCLTEEVERRSGLMVSALFSESSGPGSSPGRGHCVVFLCRTPNFHSASLHPFV